MGINFLASCAAVLALAMGCTAEGDETTWQASWPDSGSDTEILASLAPAGTRISCANQPVRLDLDRAAGRAPALAMMWMAARAYVTDLGAVDDELRSAGFDRVAHVGERTVGLQVLLARRPQFVVVAFRGSDELADWFGNIDVTTRPWSDFPGGVHRGFAGMLDGGWPDLVAALEDLRDREQPVWLTGHSLGGALAALAGARLARDGIPVAGVHTFAAPRVGDREFASAMLKQLEGRLERYAVAGDMVPHLIPSADAATAAGRLFGTAASVIQATLAQLDYRHGAALRQLVDGDGQIAEFPEFDESVDADYWTGLVDTVRGSWEAVLGLAQHGQAHSLGEHLCRLQAANRTPHRM
jgi:hypothetical protein